MKTKALALALLIASLAGCVVVPVGPPRPYYHHYDGGYGYGWRR